MNLVADAAHNFTDGLALGAAYRTNFGVGVSTTLADAVLWASLVRYDNVYARQFGLGERVALGKSYPHCLAYVRRVVAACPRLMDELEMEACIKIYVRKLGFKLGS